MVATTHSENWCNLLAGVITLDLVNKLDRAAALAEQSGEPDLARDLRDWESRVQRALHLEPESGHRNRPEIWLG